MLVLVPTMRLNPKPQTLMLVPAPTMRLFTSSTSILRKTTSGLDFASSSTWGQIILQGPHHAAVW
jgi:hypothetical protein